MRMKFKPYARPELAAWPNYVDSPKDHLGQWRQAFSNPSSNFQIELGCGKGGFISQIGLRQPLVNHLGLDIKSEVLVVAKRTIEKQYQAAGAEPDNILITSWDIERIGGIISPADAVSTIYINFCNPWYKTGDAKHRLTHPRQLIQYRDFLVENGEIRFKTDDGPLFFDTLRYFEYSGFDIVWKTEDLHKNEPEWNIRTEHEGMFSEQGIAIKACIAKIKQANLDKDAFSKLKDI